MFRWIRAMGQLDKLMSGWMDEWKNGWIRINELIEETAMKVMNEYSAWLNKWSNGQVGMVE